MLFCTVFLSVIYPRYFPLHTSFNALLINSLSPTFDCMYHFFRHHKHGGGVDRSITQIILVFFCDINIALIKHYLLLPNYYHALTQLFCWKDMMKSCAIQIQLSFGCFLYWYFNLSNASGNKSRNLYQS